MRGADYDTYIGRAGFGEEGDFGNPFVIGKDGDRDTVIEKFKFYFYERIKRDPVFKADVKKLKGKVLGCFCKPKRCHGDVIAEYLDSPEVQKFVHETLTY